MIRSFMIAAAVGVFGVAGCGKADETAAPTEPDADTDTDSDTDTDTDADTDTDSDTDTEPACDGYRAWDPSGSASGRFGTLAGDLTFQTTGSDEVRLSDLFDGCSSVMFLFYDDFNAYATATWWNGLSPIIARSPENVHYVAVSFSDDEDDRFSEVDYLEFELDSVLGAYDEATQQHWREHTHFVLDDGDDMGWLGDLALQAVPVGGDLVPIFGAGVDRTQTVRRTGATLDWATGTWEPSFLAYEAVAYEFELARDLAMAAEPDVTEVTIFDHMPVNDSGWSGARGTVDVTLPDLSGYDTMEFDLELGCADADDDGIPECPEWDRETMGYLCDGDDGDWCSWEVGRWITAYSHEGRWVHDASPLLAMLGDGGGTRRFQFYTVDPFTITWKLRLSNRGKGMRPTSWSPGFVGGGLDENYDANHPPIAVDVPKDAVKFELFAILSGHGSGTDTKNCAEFCDHEHRFSIGADSWLKAHETAGTYEGCQDDVGNGTIPNQWGSWPYGRAGWCPGKDVVPWVADMTSAVTPGATASVAYSVTVDGAPYVPVYTGGGDYYPTIKLQSYFVGWTAD